MRSNINTHNQIKIMKIYYVTNIIIIDTDIIQKKRLVFKHN